MVHSARIVVGRARYGLIVLAACHTTGVREDTAPPKTAASASASAIAAVTDAAPPPVARTEALFAFAEGACPKASVRAIGREAVILVQREAWAVNATGVELIYRMPDPKFDRYLGFVPDYHVIGQLGGTDRDHAYVQTVTSSGRGEDTSIVHYGNLAQLKALTTPHGNYGAYGQANVIQQPDGTVWIYGVHNMYADIPGEPRDPPNQYFAFSATGDPIKGVNVPGADMANAVRMESGELVAPGITSKGAPELRRWSPTRKVDDLLAAGAPTLAIDKNPELRIGTTTAVLAMPAKLRWWIYADDKLRSSTLNVKVDNASSWLVTKADELMATAGYTLYIETKDGAVTEEKLPEPGTLAPEPSEVWLIGKSNSIYARKPDKTWHKWPLPDTTPPSKVEWVRVQNDEVFVSTVRTDIGFGRKKPGEIRTLYSSVKRAAPLRCGLPFSSGALRPFPPKADDTCKTLVVTALTETTTDEKPDYPKLGAALKGDAALGDSVTFIGFGPEPERVLGIAARSRAVADELVKRLDKVVTSAPEIVCGSPDEHRRLTFDVKTAKFASP
jgi:hypothetical protein